MKNPWILSDWLRNHFRKFIDGVADIFIKLKISANWLTLMGAAGHIIAAIFLAYGQYFGSGITLLIFAPLDAFDGAVARKMKITSKYGAFLDSVTDRYSEAILMCGFLMNALTTQSQWGIILAFLAMCGSFLVPYTRARAESLGFSARNGIFSRVERYLIIIPCLIFGQALICLLIVAVLSNFTAFQRIWSVYSQSIYSKNEN
jgi:CDP-diacylglycerol--glycerol-3-phosphate 3-phosphatidyltransferase